MIRKFGILVCLLILCGCVASSGRTTVAILPAVPPPVFKVQPKIIVIGNVPDVYYVDGYVNVFYYGNSWYYYCENKWFVGPSYNGPWGYIEAHQLPVRFGQIPPGHLRTPPGQAKPKPGRDKNPPPGHSDRDDDDDGPPGHRKKGK